MRAALQSASAQLPYAIASAINSTAFQVMQAERAEIKRVFDRPTPFVQKGIRYQKATKQTLTATVYAAPKPAQSLIAEVEGGQRKTKTFEAIMRNAGVLPAGRYIVPGSGAKLDRYGNIDRSQLVAILSKLGALSSSASLSKRNTKALASANTYFIGGKGASSRLYPGIWQRQQGGKGIKPVLLFVSRATYSPRYQFERVARDTVMRQFTDNFDKAWAKAMATAR